MADFSINNIQVKGIAAAVPKKEVSNWDDPLFSDVEKKLLIKTTGVEKRRVIENGVTTSDLCYHSAEKLLEDLDWKKETIQVVIFLSQSRDYYLPATAIILQDRLGLPKTCMAFDMSLGCSGYVYGLSVISSMMSATGLTRGLLMMGDISSFACSKEDKSTYPLFGDAGSATAIEYNSDAAEMNYSLNSDGSGFDAIMIPDGGARNWVSKESLDLKDIEPGIRRSNLDLALKGLDVFNFSVGEVPKSIKEFFEKTKTSSTDYDYFLMHQANKLMNETIRKKLKFREEQVPYSLPNFGNTSSASIPLTIVTELQEQVKTKPLNLLMSGFGVGLSWGISSLQIDKIVCPDLIEI